MSNTKSVVLYLHVHQPWRIKPYSVFDIAGDHQYFNSNGTVANNREIFEKVADKSYRPMNTLLLELLKKHPKFKLSLSITGVFVEQALEYAPDVIDGFKRLVETGRVEIVAETYHHSLAFFYDKHEFIHQVQQHREMVESVFGATPTAFRGTELSYNNDVAAWADQAGYEAIIAEGWDPILGSRSPNHVYQPAGTNGIRLLTKNYRLSDDVAFRFSDKAWKHHPLSASTYHEWASTSLAYGDVLNLFMDYETFGEHQWADTGIFAFYEAFVEEWLNEESHDFATITEASKRYDSRDVLDVPHTLTWADTERDLSAWTGNAMQQEILRHLYDLGDAVRHSGDEELIKDWRRLQTSDHVYYMCTKWFNDGDVHAYFSPYDSPYDAFLYVMNALRDLRYRSMHSHLIGGTHG